MKKKIYLKWRMFRGIIEAVLTRPLNETTLVHVADDGKITLGADESE